MASFYLINKQLFQIIEKLGNGSTCQVYKAKNLDTNVICALKIFNISQDAVNNEVEIQKIVGCPFIYLSGTAYSYEGGCAPLNPCPPGDGAEVLGKICDDRKVLESKKTERKVIPPNGGRGGGAPCIVEQLMSDIGTELGRVWNNTILKKIIIISILKQLNTLNNELNLLHNDVKPSNIMFDNKNFKLIDYGHASFLRLPLIKNCGTPGFRPPEIIFKKGVDITSDLWSLGMTAIYFFFPNFRKFKDDNEYIEHFLYRKFGNELKEFCFKNHIITYEFSSDVEYPSSWSKMLSEDPIMFDFYNFLDCIFKLNPSERKPINRLLNHHFLTSY